MLMTASIDSSRAPQRLSILERAVYRHGAQALRQVIAVAGQNHIFSIQAGLAESTR